MSVPSKIVLFIRDESGATLVEYGVALLLAITVGGVALGALAGSTTTAIETGTQVLNGVSSAGAN